MIDKKLKVKIVHYNNFVDTFMRDEYIFLQGHLFIYVFYKSYRAKIALDNYSYKNVFIISNKKTIKIF